MNNVAGAVLLGFVLIAPMVVYGAYRVLRLIKGGPWIGAVLAAAALLLVAASAGVLLLGGTPASGTVIRKHDSLQLARLELVPSVLHILRVEVALASSASGQGGDTVMLPLDPQSFDRLHEGDPIALMQTAIGPVRFARLAGAPGWSHLPVLEFRGVAAVCASVLSLLAAIACVLTPAMRARGRMVTVGLVASALLADGAVMRPLWMSRPSRASASVVETHTVREALLRDRLNRRSTETFRLPLAYDEVTFTLTPAPGEDPVTAIDRIDEGSSGGLQVGSVVNVDFAASAPRDARLVAGHRRYLFKAWSARYGAAAVLGGLVAAAVSVAVWAMSRRRRGARPAPAAAEGPGAR
jgi:hypothetical protein